MLNSAEHEIFSANKYENANNSCFFFSYLLAEKFSCSAMFSKKEFVIVSNLRFISRTNFVLSCVQHKKVFYNLGARCFQFYECVHCSQKSVLLESIYLYYS